MAGTDYSQNIFKTPQGTAYSIVNGIARPFTDQASALAAAPNAQTREMGVGTTGYDAQHGGGTTGGAWSFANYQNTLDTLANQGGNNAPVTPYTPPQAPQNAPASSPTTIIPTGNNNRSLISQTPQPGYIKGYDTNSNNAPVYVPAGKYVPGIMGQSEYDAKQKQGKLNPASFNPAQTITAAPGTSGGATGTGGTSGTTGGTTGATGGSQGATDAKTAADTAVADIAQKQADIKASQTDTQKQAGGLSADVVALLGGEAGKSAFENQQRSALEDPINTELTHTQNDITSFTSARDAALDELSKRPMSQMSFLNESAAINSKANSQILSLTARANVLMNNLSLAEKQVQQAVDAKYKPIEEMISIKQAQLAALQPQLTADEKVQSEALSASYQHQQKLVDDAKATETQLGVDKNSVLADYLKAGGTDKNVMDKISSATSKEAALIAAGGQLAKMGQLDLKEKQANLNKINTANNTNASNGTPVTNTSGQPISIPKDLVPYAQVSHSGVAYLDASSLKGTPKQQKTMIDEATQSGIKVITNKNTATDVFNIADANNKLDTVADLLKNIDQPGWVQRTAYGLGLTWLADKSQSNPQQAASGVLSSIGTDILKAMQGVQGSRMSQAAVANINKELPNIYDTADTVAQKVSNLKALLSDREDAILGKSNQGSSGGQQVSIGGSSYSAGQTLSNGSLTLTINPDLKSMRGSDGKNYDLKGNVIK